MMVLDKEGALERIYFEKLRKSEGRGASQSCLFPQQIRLNGPDYALTMEMKAEIESLGFEFSTLGEQIIVIQGVPLDLAPCNEKDVFEGLLEQFKQNVRKLEIPRKEGLQRALARRLARNRANAHQQEEVDALIDRLFGCEQPNYTPDGKPTYVLISLDKINDWFGR
jgi:DNA mismatch repair protein MutL